MEEFFKKITESTVLSSIVAIVISFIIYKIIVSIISKGSNKLTNNRAKTYFKMMRSVCRYIFIILTIFALLQINGVNVSSMLAGVGIVSVIIGFAVQDVLKDIIKGTTIISDKYFQVGDIIKFNDIEGKVLTIGLKSTKIEDVRSFNIISIANRNIEQVEVVSNSIDVFVPMPYEVSVETAERAIDTIVGKIKALENVDSCMYKGVNELADSSIKYQINTRCHPDLKVQMRRNILRCVLLGLAENNIQVPYNQIDVHSK